MFTVGLLLATAVALPTLARAQRALQTRYEVRLKSRTFTPEEDVREFLNSGRRYGIVQFYNLPSASQHRALDVLGVKLEDCLPDHAYLAYIHPDVTEAALEANGVRALTPVEPSDRQESGRAVQGLRSRTVDLQLLVFPQVLRTGEAESTSSGGRVTVCHKGRRTLTLPRSALPRHLRHGDAMGPCDVGGRNDGENFLLSIRGVKILGSNEFYETIRVRVRLSTLRRLRRLDWIRWIEPAAGVGEFLNDNSREIVRVLDVQASPYSQVQNMYQLTGDGVITGMWEPGQPWDHADFGTRVTNVDQFGLHPHSTHVCGTMAGSGLRSVAEGGTSREWAGAAPEATVYAHLTDDQVHEEMLDAHNNFGVIISQNSWTYEEPADGQCDKFGDYVLESNYYDQFVAFIGVHTVFAAGNSADDGYACIPPQGFGTVLSQGQASKNTITVGAMNNDGIDTAIYSSRGPAKDGRLKPEIVAVGGSFDGSSCDPGVESTASPSGPDNTIDCEGEIDGYSFCCGTSMAAPMISGLLALMIERYRTRPYIIANDTSTINPAVDVFRGILFNTATDVGPSGPDFMTGYGIANALHAIEAIDAGAFRRGTAQPPDPDVYEKDFELNVANANRNCRVKVMLSWVDKPASPMAQVALVNDLDLTLIQPVTETAFLPLVLDPNNPSSAALLGVNELDNTEQVVLKDPVEGKWQIRVRGTSVMSPGQVFAVTWHADGGCKLEGGPQF